MKDELRMMKDEWRRMKDEWRMMKDEEWMMKDEDFKLLRGFEDRQTDEQKDICECRVAFATENFGHVVNKSLVICNIIYLFTHS